MTVEAGIDGASGLAWTVFTAFLTPTGMAMLVSIGVTQVIKMATHYRWLGLPRRIKRGELWALSWVVTAVVVPLLCWIMGVLEPAKHVPLGIAAGFFSPFVVSKLKSKFGIDIDKITGLESK